MSDGAFEPLESVVIEDELRLHGAYASVTRGTSMRPLFKTHRDIVVIGRADGDLKKYDVALYRAPSGRYVLHRVVRVYPDRYLIRGDNTFIDEYIMKSDIIGVLTGFNRKGREYTVEGSGYRLYSRFWVLIYPLRKLCYRVNVFLHKLYRFVFRRGKRAR